ncbi:permease [Vespertiliibacter pulmonis]|uniref:Chloramphenicol-sensitive protein RarD n=1 Tax=Vespertiliibacter pulmonis TaxID=1443036 RepID=A0A3N4WCP6_9PAST|nr:EamA family transporter RarD [Vespertiliibacter pulmonis]QLB21090.1 permease [Vespertiliibacter pulmonis]RPE83810.1 chloramphenicol-sensitive protein RarD [Vespertiliibacter pulmonis]
MIRGVVFAILSNILFGTGYYFAVLLLPLDDMGMFGLRVIVLIPLILLVIFIFSQQKDFNDLWQKIVKKPPLVLIILLLAMNVGVQLWLFIYAPNNGQALPVSIGYLLLPIVASALGKLVFKEHFTPLKWGALLFAAIGVAVNLILTNSISWATFIAAFGYPIYIVLRRYFDINSLATLVVELCLCLPVAVYYVAQSDLTFVQQQNPYFYGYLILFGLVNCIAFISYIRSSNLLPVNVLGLLGYFEPLVMLIISFLIGEILDAKSYLLMICLSLSIVLLIWDSLNKGEIKS